ncbi:MAG: hypothetical protein ACLFP6_12280 [Spirochaetaceae bacterium]
MAGEAFRRSREALIELMAARKLEEKRRRDLEAQFAIWEARARNAQQLGKREAAKEALNRCNEIADENAAALVQIEKLDDEIALAEAQLKQVAVAEERSVDTEALLASLEGAAGTGDRDRRRLEELEQKQSVEDELARLKERLNLD